MDKKSSLVSFRVSPDSWEQFKEWAKSRGNTASSELQTYIQTCIGGSIDVTAPSVNTNLDGFERRLTALEASQAKTPAPEIDSLRSEMESLRGEIDDLKKSSLSAA